MSIDAATFRTHLEAARVALQDGDYATAETQALAAQATLAGLSEGRRGDSEIKWMAETVNQLIASIRIGKANTAANRTVRRTPITYVRESETDDV